MLDLFHVGFYLGSNEIIKRVNELRNFCHGRKKHIVPDPRRFLQIRIRFNLDPRIRTTEFPIRIQIFSSISLKTSSKKLTLLLTVGTFTTVFNDNKIR
jgi:hypothetical protein